MIVDTITLDIETTTKTNFNSSRLFLIINVIILLTND